MADVRSYAGIPPLGAFGGIVTPTPCSPLIADSTTGDLYVALADVPTRVSGSSISAGLTATGTNQGTALALSAALNELTTVAAGTGAILTAGPQQTVYNGGTNQLSVYPPSGAKINQLAANAPILLPVSTAATFYKLSSTKWIGSRSA